MRSYHPKTERVIQLLRDMSKQTTKKAISEILHMLDNEDFESAHQTKLYRECGGVYCRILEYRARNFT